MKSIINLSVGGDEGGFRNEISSWLCYNYRGRKEQDLGSHSRCGMAVIWECYCLTLGNQQIAYSGLASLVITLQDITFLEFRWKGWEVINIYLTSINHFLVI